MTKKTLFEIAGLVALGAFSRLMPHLPNMTAMNAVALKSRTRFGLAGLLIPLVSMAISDVIIGFYDWRLLLSVYASFALVSTLGTILRTLTLPRIASVSVFGSMLFFLITNAIVWATSPWYPATFSGLIACYLAGLPFGISMLVGDMLFSLALFRGASAFKYLNVGTFTSRAVGIKSPYLDAS